MARNKKMETKIVIDNLLMASVAISGCALLFACGGDSGSSGAPEKVELVSSVDDLGKCTEDIEGDTVFVKDEKTDYICIKGKWTNADSLDSQIHENGEEGLSSSVQDDGKGSCSSMDKISSSSSNRDDNESSSSVALSSSSAKSESNSSSSFKYEQDSSAFVQPDIVAVKDKSINGVSQKGPFVTGSTIKLYELDGKTYTSTGKSFPGKIASDDGKFRVSSVTLASQYALLEANGYFRNEITGGKSKGTITLNALTDLSDRKSVNINLLTHLEYERALYLVGTGINVPSAKKQAEAEILNAFGIKGEFANSEDLDIFSTGDGNAALLAFSVLMLGDLGEADLTERMTNFATDMEKDGSWDDEATKAKIADWANRQDVWGGLSTIRSIIEDWKLGTVPAFEKYVRNFWYSVYGLGECSEEREGTVLAVQNKNSTLYNTKNRFICKSGAWIVASDIEMDTYLWLDPSNTPNYKDADVRRGDVEESNCYVFENNVWRSGNESDCSLGLRGCTAQRQGDVEQAEDYVWYVCKAKNWEMSWKYPSSVEEDVRGQKCSEFGQIIHGAKNTENLYFCNWPLWKRFFGNESITYGKLEDERDGRVYRTVKIGDQIWMAENLNYADSVNYPSMQGKNWCLDDEPTNCELYGRLYTWSAAIDSLSVYSKSGQECGFKRHCILTETIQGICPNGWHVPSIADFKELAKAVGGTTEEGACMSPGFVYSEGGKKLMMTTPWLYYDGDMVSGTDDYGFTAIPYWGNHRSGKFVASREYINVWTSYAYDYAMWIDRDRVGVCDWFYDNGYGAYGFPVRCIQD